MRSAQGRQGAAGYDMMRWVRMGFGGLVSDEKMNAAPASTCSTGSTRRTRVVLRDGRRVWGSLVLVPFAPALSERLPTVPSSRLPLAARASPVFGPCLILPREAIR
jgi:hypothetical protein